MLFAAEESSSTAIRGRGLPVWRAETHFATLDYLAVFELEVTARPDAAVEELLVVVEAATTLTDPLPVIEPSRDVTVIVSVSTVLSVTWNEAMPLVNVTVAGTGAAPVGGNDRDRAGVVRHGMPVGVKGHDLHRDRRAGGDGRRARRRRRRRRRQLVGAAWRAGRSALTGRRRRGRRQLVRAAGSAAPLRAGRPAMTRRGWGKLVRAAAGGRTGRRRAGRAAARLTRRRRQNADAVLHSWPSGPQPH